jgi:hypothetical protein
MIIIFLDIDGVLRTHKSDLEWSLKLGEPIPELCKRNFSKTAVSNLNEITGWSRAKIVVISTWRTLVSFDDLKKIFKDNGVSSEVIGVTPVGLSRGEEIEQYISDNNIVDYVVIDDNVGDIINIINKERVVKIDSKIGLEDENIIDHVLDILL